MIFAFFKENHMVPPYNFGTFLRKSIWSPLTFFAKYNHVFLRIIGKNNRVPPLNLTSCLKKSLKIQGGGIYKGVVSIANVTDTGVGMKVSWPTVLRTGSSAIVI